MKSVERQINLNPELQKSNNRNTIFYREPKELGAIQILRHARGVGGSFDFCGKL